MRYVVAVARAGNFTHAAEGLHVAQQALSQQVRAVEEMIGTPLFDRASRPVTLTPAGVVFVQEAKRVLAAADRVVERTQAAALGTLGKLRLAYTFATAYETLPALLEGFATDAPHVRVNSREMYGSDMIFYLKEDKLDVALTPHTQVEDDLTYAAVRREPFVVTLPEHHHLAASRAINLWALRNEVFQGWPTAVAPGYHAAVIAACHSAGFEPKLDDTSTGSTAWNNIAAGRGVALVVASAAPQVPRGIALLPLGTPKARITIDIVWRRDNDLPPVRRFVDTARRVSREREWLE